MAGRMSNHAAGSLFSATKLVSIGKLAAMSAVIGAGSFVVWQAQQGLNSANGANSPTVDAFTSSTGDNLANLGESAPTLRPNPGKPNPGFEINPDPNAAPTPIAGRARELTPPVAGRFSGPALAMASTPPESTPPESATASQLMPEPDPFASTAPPPIAEPSPLSTPQRYSRGLDFRRVPVSAAEGTTADTIVDSFSADSQPADQPSTMSSPSPRRSGTLLPSLGTGEITPASATEAPAKTTNAAASDDPFFGAAPPAMSGNRPTQPDLGAATFDPLADEPPRMGTPAAAPTRLPIELDQLNQPPGRDAPPQSLEAPVSKPAKRLNELMIEQDDPFAGSAPPPLGAANPAGPANPAAPAMPIVTPNPTAPIPSNPAPANDPFASDPLLDLAPPAGNPPSSKTPPKITPRRDPTVILDEPRSNSSSSTSSSSPDFDPFGEANIAPPGRREPPRERSPAPVAPSTNNRRATEASNPALMGDGIIGDSVPRGLQEPRLTIEKTAPPKAVLGMPLVYTVVVRNTGGSPANQVVVEDRIPRGSRLVGTAPRAEMIEKRLVWKLGTLAPNEEKRISIKVVPEEEGSIGSVARVNFVSEVAAEIVITAPQIRIRATGPSEVKMGETAELVYVVSNAGEGDATNVVLRSLIPDGLQHPAGSDLEYKIDKLPAKESREVRLEVTAAKPGRVTQQTIVTADGNVNLDAKTAIEVIGEQLVLTRNGHAKVYMGRPAVFSNRVGNEGQRPVNRIKVTELVPAGFEFVEATDGGHFDAGSRTITWMVGPVSPGSEQKVSATLLPKQAGQYESTISAVGPTGSVATVKPPVVIEGFPSLALEPLTEHRPASVGERVTTRMQLRNKGSAAASNVIVVVDLPPEVKFVSAKGPGSYQMDGRRVTFTPVGQLLPRDTAAFELVVDAIAAGDGHIELQISADHLRRPVKHDEALQIVGDGM